MVDGGYIVHIIDIIPMIERARLQDRGREINFSNDKKNQLFGPLEDIASDISRVIA